ncbi:MAG: hypothetical protein Q8R53_05975 [Nanoarchaeota archaeon]|nr:hypothetical protein [Nanoarchaeota archaeon]
MTPELSGPSEKVVPYRYFGNGRVLDLMPDLVKAGYHPAGIAVLLDRRQHAPEEVAVNFNTYFWTGDSAGTDEKGGAVLTLDSPLLRELTAESHLVNGALRLEPEQWRELKADREHSLHLTPAEVEAANEKGYVFKDGKFVPAHKAVAKAWDYLNRGNDVQSYAQMVSAVSKINDIMRLYFDRSQPSTPTLRSLVLVSFDSDSYVYGDDFLNGDGGRLVGVAPEAHVAREKALETRVQSALEAGKAFEFNGRVYAPVSGVTLE